MTYDHAGRLENTYYRVNGGAEQWISKLEYTIKDELKAKHLGGLGSSFLQNVDYAYLSNGFLQHINQTMAADDLFQFEINYDIGNSTLGAPAQKNGNISQLTWQVKGKQKQTYGFQYDFLNRLTTATYGEYNPTLSANNYYNTSYTYDNRGNMMNLNRQGFLPDSTYAQIDNLAYTYNTSSNRIKRVTDNAPAASKSEGFQPGLLPADYGYDDNGNMNYDPNKGMNIRYNYLNLPEFIEFSNCKIIEYTYDATGLKLTKTLKSGNAVTSTHDYVGDIEYKNQFLDAIYHPEGRLYFEDTIPRYEYVIRDHLGNSRLCFTDKDGNGTIDLTGNGETTEALEETHYYPFGMRMKGAWLKNEGRENKYLYNGKELQDEFDLNVYDYGARIYDPAAPHFWSVDLLADEYAPFSPYVYGANNPLRYTDPFGSYIVDENGNKVTANVSQNDEGVYAATFTDIEGNTISSDSEFGQNAGIIIDALLQTETGREQFNKLNDSEAAITLKLSEEQNVRKNSKGQTVTRFAGTKITDYKQNSDGTYSSKAATITVYQGSIERITNRDKVYKSEKFNLMEKAGIPGSIGAVAGHEAEHAVNQSNVNQNLSNQLKGTKHNIEKGPKAITMKILREAAKNKKP